MKKNRILIVGFVIAFFLLFVAIYFQHHPVTVLDPRGAVASQERNLILFTVLLSLFVVLPVYALTFMIARKYRAGNKSARYTPEWDHNPAMEFLWWAIPGAIILILSVVTWNSSHTLDPFRPVASNSAPINIQVVALDWKWLFIYPEQRLASVNSMEIPVDTPISFSVTADAPMNSFWIPQLGSQIYAMPGMSTQLHLMATQTGNYYGSSANISGPGFAGMHFTAHAVAATEFSRWTRQHANSQLNWNSYQQLAKPSQNNLPKVYALTDNQLYDKVVGKYLLPAGHYSITINHGAMH